MNSKECLEKLKSMPSCSECENYGKCFDKPLCNELYDIITQDLKQLGAIKEDNTRLWHGLEYANNENAKLKQALNILKNRFEIILYEHTFPISESKYFIGFKYNNDDIWIYVPQEEYELLKEVLEYE